MISWYWVKIIYSCREFGNITESYWKLPENYWKEIQKKKNGHGFMADFFSSLHFAINVTFLSLTSITLITGS